MLYTIGTLSVNGNTATGTGTNWTAPASQIRLGQTLVVLSNPVQLFQITAINSATSLTVTPAASPALTGQKYGILVTDAMSVDGLAQSISQLINEYDENIGAWETFATTSANQNITVTINGSPVTIPGIGKLAQKGSNGALAIADGGTGATTAEGSRKNLGLGSSATRDVGTGTGTVAAGDDSRLSTIDGKSGGTLARGTGLTISEVSKAIEIMRTSYPGIHLVNWDLGEEVAGRRAVLEQYQGTVYIARRGQTTTPSGSTSVIFPNSSGTLALSTSDATLKDVSGETDPETAFSRINALRAVEYRWNKLSGGDTELPRRGFIAQEANAVSEEYGLPPLMDGAYWGIDDRAIIADLVLCVQSMAKRLRDIEES